MATIFDEFTNQYSLTKTLRFELKPIGNTQQMLVENHVFKKDGLIKQKYEEIKPYIDRLHRDFVKEALSDVKLATLDSYYQTLRKWQGDRNDKQAKKRLEEAEKTLRKEIVGYFEATGNRWVEEHSGLGLKKKGTELLFEERVFSLLKKLYGDEDDTKIVSKLTGEMVSIFDGWKGFTGYFKKFHETRKNFYKEDGTATAHATRIIDLNLRRFSDNLTIFRKIKDKIDFSEAEDDLGIDLGELLDVEYYNQCLLQDGIDTYNRILGGEAKKDGRKLKGINEVINKYRQDHKQEKIPFLAKLDKQILSEKDKFIDEIEDDDELRERLLTFHRIATGKVTIIKKLFSDFAKNNNDYSLDKIYLSKKGLETISRRWISDTDAFNKALYEVMKPDKPSGLKYDKKQDSYKFPDFTHLDHIRRALEQLNDIKPWKDKYYVSSKSIDLSKGQPVWEQFLKIFSYEFTSLFKHEVQNTITGKIELAGYDPFIEDFENLLNGGSRLGSKESKMVIKNFLDSVLTQIYAMSTYFAVEKKRKWLSEYKLDVFYTDPEMGFLVFYKNAYEGIVQNYNLIRNYLTRKPWEAIKKWKLNFENPTLADGWDKNKERDNNTVLFRKNGDYFVGIMKKGANYLFSEENKERFSVGAEEGVYEKMVYKLLPGASKMLPKVFFSKSNIDFFAPSKDVLDIRNYSSHTKNGKPQSGFTKRDFNIKDAHKFIDFFKDSLGKHPEWRNFNFKFSATSSYQDISEFYREVEEGGYMIMWQDISEKYVNDNNKIGKLYLFQIRNKDWNLKEGKPKTGSKNLHTIYFESVFSPENMEQSFKIKLNGQAEIFYRPKTDKGKLGYMTDSKNRKVLRHKRYAENKILFHVPITLNRTAKKASKFNNRVNNFLAGNHDINVIGVDRGEKHLAYYSVVNQKGEVLQDSKGKPVSGTLNLVGQGGNGGTVDYHRKLEEKARKRKQARKDWQDIQGIKDLKRGYISQVVRKLADLALEHNAIIVFEDLNMRFKQIRGGIEKSTYQQLEKALIEKLNFLVKKDETDSEKAGHVLNAYQLTAPFDTFQKMGKQTGIIYYTQASYTSKIDPLTGWRPNLYLKYTNAEKAKELIMNFDTIEFNRTGNRFDFTYDLKKFVTSREYPNKIKWTVSSSVERFRWNRSLNENKGGYEHYEDLTDNFKKLFDEYSIDYFKGDILGQIESLEAKGNESFFKEFIFYWKLLSQIRNTQQDKDGDENDFILSPVEPFFDSRKADTFGEKLPQNGDDNGAYNIARKGVIILDKISNYHKKHGDCEKLSWGDLFISHIDWDNFAQSGD